MVSLTHDVIHVSDLAAAVSNANCGAVVIFLGTVRDMTGDAVTEALEYEAYAEMAEKVLAVIEADTRDRWPARDVVIVHRLGRLGVGEVSVGVAVACPHRADAFAACQFAIDRVKELAPIWKRDHRPGGTSAWVHPGAPA